MKIKYSIVSLIINWWNKFPVSIGQSEGKTEINANGGQMDTQQYYGVINNTTENYRIAGIIISVVGGIGIILSGCGIYKGIK